MFARLAALFVIVPALELYLLIRLGTLIGAAETFGIILLTGLVGSYLAKSQGLSVWRRFQTKLGSGSVPGAELLDGVIILISAALLITPGVLTDVIGFLGLVPGTRSLLRKYLYARFLPLISTKGVRFNTTSTTSPNNGFTNYSGQQDLDDRSNSQEVHVGGTARKRPSQDSTSEPRR